MAEPLTELADGDDAGPPAGAGDLAGALADDAPGALDEPDGSGDPEDLVAPYREMALRMEHDPEFCANMLRLNPDPAFRDDMTELNPGLRDILDRMPWPSSQPGGPGVTG
ncbi:hypothetical protein [Streptomyces mashuensis]|nr:hypothetical protein [Streptomyces mashuensis]